MQRAGRFGGGRHNRGGFQWLQGVEDNIGCVFHVALPLQLSQFIQSRVHSSFNILQNEKSEVTTGDRNQFDEYMVVADSKTPFLNIFVILIQEEMLLANQLKLVASAPGHS